MFLKLQRMNFQFMSNGVFLSLFHGDRGGEGSFHLLRVRGDIVFLCDLNTKANVDRLVQLLFALAYACPIGFSALADFSWQC